MTRNNRGLTLVEVLVALAILGLLSLLAYRALDSTLRVRERVTVDADRWRELSFFFERLREDIDQPAPRGPRAASGEALPAVSGTATTLELAVLGSGSAPLRRVQYRWQDGVVELLLWPVFDAAPATVPEVHALAHGVSGFRWRYLNASRAWVDAWTVPAVGGERPRAIGLDMTLADGTAVTRVFALP